MKRKLRKRKQKSSVWSGLRTGALTLGLLIIAGGILHSVVGTYQRRYEVEREKQEFVDQIQQIRQESEELSKIREFISTEEYQEREAKQKLDLEQPGEQAIIVTPASIVESLSGDDLVRVLKEPKSEELVKAQTNPEKWWAFFFDKARL